MKKNSYFRTVLMDYYLRELPVLLISEERIKSQQYTSGKCYIFNTTY